MIALAIYNTFYFLIRQGRYRIYFITCFYGFAFIVIICRLVLAIVLLCVIFDYSSEYDLSGRTLLTFVALQIVAVYAKICLGFF